MAKLPQCTLCVFLLTLSLFGLGQCVCPDRDSSLRLKKWSRSSTWPHGKPGANAAVIISNHVLLDEQPPDLKHIRITRTGRLVWSTAVNVTLRLKYIYIEGRMDIGSEDCPYTGPAKIVLKGHRGEFNFKDHMGMLIGDKVIVVADGGTLEIHGKKKLPWTKLTKTVPKLTMKNGLLYDHKLSDKKETENWEHGINAYVFNVDSHHRVKVKSFGSYELYSTWQADRERQRLIHIFQNLTTGDILTMAVRFELNTESGDLSTVFDAFETMAFGQVNRKSVLRTVKKHDAYTAIIYKKDNGLPDVAEDISKFYLTGDVMTSTSSSLPVSTGVKVTAVSHIDTRPHKGYLCSLDFRVSTIAGAFPKLHVVDDTSSWQIGDKVVLSSTDYDWQQAELATIVYCTDCTNKEIRVDLEAQYEHWGVIENRVDERGEVALLSRNIVIEGEVEPKCVSTNQNCQNFNRDTYGGQTKFLRGSTVHIEGVELIHMGQQTDVGRYPLHFHMGFDMRNMTHPPYVQENSIHDAFSRCVTVHGTHGVLVKDNVCYNTLGHAYFIEDGGEKDTTFDGNIAISVRKGTVIPSDQKPAAFWITSPLTRLRNNVAAGGEGTGIWYLFPDEPVGPSKGLGFFQPTEASRTAVLEFDNNVAHSHTQGLFFDSVLQPDGGAGGQQSYSPKVDPLDPKSADKEVRLYRLTAFKNGYQNVWLRGGWINVVESSIADSAKAITMARSSNQEQFVTNSVIIGFSKNLGEPAVNWTRSFPVSYDRHTPIQGFTFYDGPVWGKNIWFNGFISTSEYMAGAIGYERNNEFSSSAASGIRNAKFGFVDGPTTGNRIYDGDVGIPGFTRKDGDKMAINRNYDSSITGHAGTSVVKPWPLFTTSSCKYRENWNMAICPYTYGKLRLDIPTADYSRTFPLMVRDDIPSINETLMGPHSRDFEVILGGVKTYTIHWTGHVARNFGVYSDGIHKGKYVRFGICITQGATFDLYTYAPHYLPTKSKWQAATSLSDLDRSQGSRYFYDSSTGMLYFKFISEFDRLDNETKSCPHNRCPMVQVKNVHGSHLSNGDCRQRLYHSARTADNRRNSLSKDTSSMRATMAHPPSNWGAGPTKPFLNRIPIDGGFGHWTHWTSCTVTCGGGKKERTRACDSPIPAHGGRECSGAFKQTQTCNTAHCPVDGGFTSWASWSTCTNTTACQGYKKRTRNCSNPQPDYGGQYCHGSDEEVESCTVC